MSKYWPATTLDIELLKKVNKRIHKKLEDASTRADGVDDKLKTMQSSIQQLKNTNARMQTSIDNLKKRVSVLDSNANAIALARHALHQADGALQVAHLTDARVRHVANMLHNAEYYLNMNLRGYDKAGKTMKLHEIVDKLTRPSPYSINNNTRRAHTLANASRASSTTSPRGKPAVHPPKVRV